MFFLELHRKFLSELSIADLHPLNLNLELVVTICQSGKVTNEILTRFLQEFLQCAAVINLPFGFMFLHRRRSCLVQKQLSECKNGFRIACSNIQTPICFEKSGFTFFLRICLKKNPSAKLVGSAPQMPDNQQSLAATEADWQNCPFLFVPMFVNINAVLRFWGKYSKYFGFEIES